MHSHSKVGNIFHLLALAIKQNTVFKKKKTGKENATDRAWSQVAGRKTDSVQMHKKAEQHSGAISTHSQLLVVDDHTRFL